MYENPNKSYWEQAGKLDDRKPFHCAREMRKSVRGDVLDLGAGTGVMTRAFTEGNEAVSSVTCADFSSVHAAALKGAGYRFVAVDLDAPPYADIPSATFDTVISTDVVEHLLSPFAYLSECHRALRPGGALVISAPDVRNEVLSVPHINFFSPASLRMALKRAGFGEVCRHYNGVLSPSLTAFTSRIPLLRNAISAGCYFTALKAK